MDSQELPKDIKLGCERFRVLIIGDPNTGKTTVLKKVHKAGKPTARNAIGNQIETALDWAPGEHDIETEIVYPPDIGFVFHVSRGFEASDCDELTKVRNFIAERSSRPDLKDRLHAVWHCLPAGDESSLATAMEFFERKIQGVPVIAIFTKADALQSKGYSELYGKLQREGMSAEEAQEEATSKAVAYEKAQLKDNSDRLNGAPHGPTAIVVFRNMHKDDTNCDELVDMTGGKVNANARKLLCICVLRNSLEYLRELAIKRVIIPTAQDAMKSGSFSEKQRKLFTEKMVLYGLSTEASIHAVIGICCVLTN